MGYHIDLKTISLDSYRVLLENKTLIPSRMILKENLESRIEELKNTGINNLEELFKLLKKKENIEKLKKQEIFTNDFLLTLKREINSMLPKPNRFCDFIFLDKDLIKILADHGFKQTKQLFERVMTPEDREILSKELGISIEDTLMLAKLTDISRIQWVNHTFAYVIYKAGYDSVKKISQADYKTLYNEIKALNKRNELYKGNISLKDMKILVEAAKMPPLDIIY